MKTILLPIHADDAFESRMQVALDLARTFDGHLNCLQITPLTAYVATDSFGGVYVLNDVIDAVQKHEDELRERTEARLARENVPWSYEHLDGDPATTIVARSRLADIVVVSRALREPKPGEPQPLAADVAIHARTPVLAVPAGMKGFIPSGTALVAWNGSPEAAYALKCSLPLLKLASEIHVVTIAEAFGDLIPAREAGEYLSRHGLKAEIHDVDRDESVGETLLAALEEIGGDYVIMGAYGHSRARELVFGGVTRRMLKDCPVPLVLAH